MSKGTEYTVVSNNRSIRAFAVLFSLVMVLSVVSIGVGAAGAGVTGEVSETASDADSQIEEVLSEEEYTSTTDTTPEEMVFIASETGTVFGLDIGGDDPEIAWEYETNEPTESSPTVADGTVYITVGVGSGTSSALYALDAETGDKEWEHSLIQGEASPTIVDGTVYVGDSVSGNVYALDADTGDTVWSESIGTGVRGAPHVVDGHVYVSGFGVNDGGLFALDADTGDQVWHYDETVGVEGSPTWDDGTLYVADRLGQGGIHAVDAETGDQEWFFEKWEAVASSALVTDGTVYFPTASSGSAGVYAVDAETGDQEWFFDDFEGAAYMEGSATADDGTIYVGTIGNNGSAWGGGQENSTLYALDGDTGDVEWEFNDVNRSIASTPTVHDNVVYVGGGYDRGFDDAIENGTMFALDASTGDELFTFDNPEVGSGFVSSPTIVDSPDGESADSRVLQGILGHTGAFVGDGSVEGVVLDTSGDAVADATVTVDGDQSTTDSNGQYSVSVGPGEHTVEIDAAGFESVETAVTVGSGESVERAVELVSEYDVGDVTRTGNVTIVDAVKIQQYLAGVLDDDAVFDENLADVQRNGDISIVDAVLIQQLLAGIADAGAVDVADLGDLDAGDDQVSVDVEHSGDLGTVESVDLRLAADEDDLDSATPVALETVDLEPGAEESLSLSVDTTKLSDGTYYYGVFTDDDSETDSFTVADD